jgi:hypothetical protein
MPVDLALLDTRPEAWSRGSCDLPAVSAAVIAVVSVVLPTRSRSDNSLPGTSPGRLIVNSMVLPTGPRSNPPTVRRAGR